MAWLSPFGPLARPQCENENFPSLRTGKQSRLFRGIVYPEPKGPQPHGTQYMVK
jgi:hypothetical protein